MVSREFLKRFKKEIAGRQHSLPRHCPSELADPAQVKVVPTRRKNFSNAKP